MNILEAYQKKLSVSEKVYSKEHGGRSLPENKKIAIARVLANTSEYITEAFESSVGTQLANMKTFKKFCLDLTTVALPSLIGNDLVIVYPMKSRTGFIQYLNFEAGSNKGGVKQGDLFNNPFRLGEMTDERVNYTASALTESVTAGEAYTATWTPIVKGVFHTITVNGTEVEFDPKATYTAEELATKAVKDAKIVATNAEGQATVTFADFANGQIAATAFPAAEGTTYKVAYKYDNITIPQNDIPQVIAEMKGIALSAKARRVAIYYSQMAAFQAKTEMGVDLGEVLAAQACAELSYEIDTEIVKMLCDNATEYADLTWNKRLPMGVSKRDHYAGFAEVVELASQHIYDNTQKHAASYMIASSSVKPILALMDAWQAASTAKVNGPYFAGTLNGIKVYISPAIAAGEFVLGFNGGDMITSAAVYAPYMMIVPTQLLGFADGAMSQGFSTLYDLQMLNPALLVKGKVVDEEITIQISG